MSMKQEVGGLTLTSDDLTWPGNTPIKPKGEMISRNLKVSVTSESQWQLIDKRPKLNASALLLILTLYHLNTLFFLTDNLFNFFR